MPVAVIKKVSFFSVEAYFIALSLSNALKLHELCFCDNKL